MKPHNLKPNGKLYVVPIEFRLDNQKDFWCPP